jgi:hypothetical protein
MENPKGPGDVTSHDTHAGKKRSLVTLARLGSITVEKERERSEAVNETN